MGGFLPSNGVGTGFARSALERLAECRGGQVFDPESLTEDYDTGYCLHEMGFRQSFVPVRFDSAGPIATREYFPRRLRAAVRQRGRWVAGIALQGWERHGWGRSWGQRYWFWRDRKGLVGNLVTPVADLISFCGLAGCFGSAEFADLVPEWLAYASGAAFFLSMLQIGVRTTTAARIYGWRFGVLAALRMPWANLINCAATLEGLKQYFVARLTRSALEWRKTDHIYPEVG